LPWHLDARIEHGVIAGPAIGRQRFGDPRMPGGIGDMKRGVLHAERIEQPLLEHLQQRLAFHHLDHAAKHVGRMAILPDRARLLRERQRGDLFGEGLVAQTSRLEVRLRVPGVDKALAGVPVGDARGVPQQVLDDDRSAQRREIEHGLAVAAGFFHADFRERETRDVPGDRLVQRELALIDQHHRHERGDRLGHRIDSKQRVRRHRRLGRDIAHAEGFEIGRLTAALHQHDRARHLAVRNLRPEEFRHRAEFFAREAELFGLALTDAFGSSRTRHEMSGDGENDRKPAQRPHSAAPEYMLRAGKE
jgi:hypothetical protein